MVDRISVYERSQPVFYQEPYLLRFSAKAGYPNYIMEIFVGIKSVLFREWEDGVGLIPDSVQWQLVYTFQTVLISQCIPSSLVFLKVERVEDDAHYIVGTGRVIPYA